MSIAGGMEQAVARAVSVQATALQVFVKSSNQWAARPFRDGEVEAFRRAAEEAGLSRHTLAHASYLINLASPDDTLWVRSVAAMREEMERCSALGIGLLVVHPGAHMGMGEEAGMARVVRALDDLLATSPPGAAACGPGNAVRVLLEITAGQGSALGTSFRQLEWILRRSAAGDRLGICFDTCHALAAGHEFRDSRSYDALLEELDATAGLDSLRAFHLNDSKGALGSRKDRHAHIGEGEVGLEAFGLILNDRRFRDLPMVLETPKGEDLAEDRANLRALRSLVAR